MGSEIDKRTVSEIIGLYQLENNLVDIYVEGKTDEEFYSYHLSKMNKRYNFLDISNIEFSEKMEDFPVEFERNNRDKIIYLINKIHKTLKNRKVFGIIDRDILSYTRGLETVPKEVFITDEGCLEAYYLTERNIEKLQDEYNKKITMDIVNSFCKNAGEIASFLIYEKKNNLSISKASIESCYDKMRKLVDIDDYIEKSLSKSKKSKIFGQVKKGVAEIIGELKSADPKKYFNGHVFFSVLTCFLKKNCNMREINAEQLECVFLLSVETQFIEEFELFRNLKLIA